MKRIVIIKVMKEYKSDGEKQTKMSKWTTVLSWHAKSWSSSKDQNWSFVKQWRKRVKTEH